MGDSAIWYTPDPARSPVKIALGGVLSDMQMTPQRYTDGSDDGMGTPRAIDYGGRWRVRITYEAFTSRSLARELRNLQSYLDRGGIIAVAADEDKAWASIRTTTDYPVNSLIVRGNMWPQYNSSGTVTTGDEIVVQSANPERHVEHHTVNSYTDPVLALTGTWRSPASTSPIIVRHQYFFPALARPVDQRGAPLVTSTREWFYTLDLTLVEVTEVYDLVAGASEEGQTSASDPFVPVDGIVDGPIMWGN